MLRAAVLAVLLATAAASDASAALSADACAEEGTCSVAMLQHAAQKSSACKCLNWKETYGAGKVKCGAGNEFYGFFSGGLKVEEKVVNGIFAKTFCTNFYEKLDHSSCVNLEMTNSSTWCYVSAACKSEDTRPLTNTTAVRAKLCGAQDATTRTTPPEELFKTAERAGMDLDTAIKLSYAVEKNFDWADAQGYWGLGSRGTKPVTEKALAPADMKEQVRLVKEQAKHEYVAIMTYEEETSPFAIVGEGKLYLVEPKGKNAKASAPAFSLRCEQGCPNR